MFRTIDDLAILQLPAHVRDDRRRRRPARSTSRASSPTSGRSPPSPAAPQVGDVLYIGLDRAVPNCAVAIHVDCEAEGHGIDPTDPPWVWEALGADGWVALRRRGPHRRVQQPGDVVVHVPGDRTPRRCSRSAPAAGCAAGSSTPRGETQTPYTDTPLLHARRRGDGRRHGDRGPRRGHRRRGRRRLRGRARAALRAAAHGRSSRPSGRSQLEVAGPDGWEPWQQVQSVRRERRRRPPLAAQRQRGRRSSSVRRCASRTASLQQYGADPAGRRPRPRAPLPHRRRPRRQRRPPTRSSRCKSAIPFIGRVDNRRPAVGGVDGETLEAAKTRGPLVLGTRNRAVTARDYEQLAREATPEVARVRCLPVDDAGRPTRRRRRRGRRARADRAGRRRRRRRADHVRPARAVRSR